MEAEVYRTPPLEGKGRHKERCRIEKPFRGDACRDSEYWTALVITLTYSSKVRGSIQGIGSCLVLAGVKWMLIGCLVFSVILTKEKTRSEDQEKRAEKN